MMDTWPEKYVIGLTGNIATGKSLVRQMLEYLGAEGIDADKAAHHSISFGTDGYQAVIQTFGNGILTPSGEIDRSALASIVFANPVTLTKLESIVHPLVGSYIEHTIRSSNSDIFVIEAIKLIEAGLHKRCDNVWVTVSERAIQLERMITKRMMSERESLIRINAQGSQEDKLDFADVIIHNNGTVLNTWHQVIESWKETFPERKVPTELPEHFGRQL